MIHTGEGNNVVIKGQGDGGNGIDTEAMKTRLSSVA